MRLEAAQHEPVFATRRIDDFVPFGYQHQKRVTAVRPHFLNGNQENVEIQKPLIFVGDILQVR